MSFFDFKGQNLTEFNKLDYKSVSHNCNKAVIAAYYNVGKNGFQAWDDLLCINQTRRRVFWLLKPSFNRFRAVDGPSSVFISEHSFASLKKKEKEVCYDLKALIDIATTSMARGIKFSDRPEVKIVDYKKDIRLDLIYDGWKRTKESMPTTFLMTFNPGRYYRSYELLDYGYNIYQKLVLIKDRPYALINFAIQDDMAFELSFLSLFKDPELKLINDQNDCIIVNCLVDLYRTRGVKYVNLGTSAGIKGLAFFKKKLPNFEQIVYRA